MESEPQNPRKKPLQDYAKFSGIAIQMLSVILLGTYGGVKLDEYFEIQSHLLTIIASLLSVALAIYIIVRKIS